MINFTFRKNQSCLIKKGLVGVIVFFSIFLNGLTVYAKHPVLQHNIDPAKKAEYEKNVAKIMSMSDEDMLSFLPDWSYTRYCECPNCFGGVMGLNVFEWSVDRPNQLKCRYCGTIFPNDKYPENRKITGKNSLGEEISFPFFFSEGRNRSHFLSSHILYQKKIWLNEQVIALGKAYQATGKEEYARRVVLILDKLSQRYPHYPVMQNGDRYFRFQPLQKPPFSWDSGKWGEFYNEIPKSMVLAYDLVYESSEFERLSKIRGYDIRNKLVNDCFHPAYKAVEASPYHLENVVGYDITSAAVLGRIVNKPSYVHRAYEWMRKNVNEGFFYDGMWKEGTASYHYMTISGIKSAFESVTGYSDPDGYIDSIDGTRFDNLNPLQQFIILNKIANAPIKMDWPNGYSSCFHDSHPYEKSSAARKISMSSILPGVGHASLGRGTDINQMQTQLHFSGSYGHAHADNLNISLFAKGIEMLPDLGYALTQLRHWTTCSLGHNLVVVNRRDQVTSGSDGDLLSFFPNTAGISVVEADGKRGYSHIEGLDMYRRLLVMIPVTNEDAYVVDLFRLRGGYMHDWTMNGDADQDTTATCSFTLDKKKKWMLEDGEIWKEPTLSGDIINPYGMVRDVVYGNSKSPFEITFRYVLDKKKGVRIHITGNEETEVWLGNSPSVRRVKEDMRKAWDFWMPKLIIRKKGKPPLQSTFAMVEEPYQGEPFISKIERVKLDPQDEHSVALRVTHGETVDTIISTLDNPPYKERFTTSGIKMLGRLGVVRQVSGVTKGVWLFDGNTLIIDGKGIKNSIGQYKGVLLDALRKESGQPYNAFVTDVELPNGHALHGTWMIVQHESGYTHGHEIDYVEKRSNKTFIVTMEDHGLKMTGNKTQEIFFPRRQFEGHNRFIISLSAVRKY